MDDWENASSDNSRPLGDESANDTKVAAPEPVTFTISGRNSAISVVLRGCKLNQLMGFRYIEQSSTSLRTNSYSWQVGGCIPDDFLKKTLSHKQPQLQSLALLTDFYCSGATYIWKPGSIDLSGLTSLKKLSWAGSYGVEALTAILPRVSPQLLELELEFWHWKRTMRRMQVYVRHAILSSASDDSLETTSEVVSDSESSDDEEDRPRTPLQAGHNVFTDQILGFRHGLDDRMRVLGTLRTLSLSHIDLRGGEQLLVNALGFDCLRCLRLKWCRGWDAFLRTLMTSEASIKLDILELDDCMGVEYPEETAELIPSFLSALKPGLRELYAFGDLYVFPSMRIFDALYRHRSTLDILVYQARDIVVVDEDDDAWPEPWYVPHMGMTEAEIDNLKSQNPAGNPIGALNLTCLGLSCFVSDLRSVVEPYVSKESLRIIHLRQDGPNFSLFKSGESAKSQQGMQLSQAYTIETLVEDTGPGETHGCGLAGIDPPIFDFANWAFGESGIPSLQIFALGDFSYDGRFAGENALICRCTPPSAEPDGTERHWRFVTSGKHDYDLGQLIDQYLHFLQAVPIDEYFI